MFDAIVVPLDGRAETELAIQPALTLTLKTGGRVVFVSVTDPGDANERRDYLAGFARASFLPNEVVVLTEGGPAEGIVAVAEAHAPALVCMSSHGRGAAGRALFGSVSAAVVRTVGAAVLVVGPLCVPRMAYTEVVVAIDESLESTAVLSAAVGFAARIGATLQVVQVLDPQDLQRAAAAGVPDSDVQESGHVAKVAAQLAEDGVAAEWEILHNEDPAAGILDYLREHPNAIVAMATHARSGLSLLAEGSVANNVVQGCANPVLLLH